MININALKSSVIKKGYNISDVAARIGVTPSTLYRKINGSTRLSIEEANKIIKMLELDKSDAVDIFFNGAKSH